LKVEMTAAHSAASRVEKMAACLAVLKAVPKVDVKAGLLVAASVASKAES